MYDGSGNCPYQISIAKFRDKKSGIAKSFREEGIDMLKANRMAEKEAIKLMTVHHCKTCALKNSGCFKNGLDIRFNEVK